MNGAASDRTRRVRVAEDLELRGGEVAVLRRLAGQTGARAGELLGLAVDVLAELPTDELREAVAGLRRRREREASCRS